MRSVVANHGPGSNPRIRACALIPLLGLAVADPDPTSRGAAEEQNFARKAAVDPPIRSTIGIDLPSSIRTRRYDGFYADGITSARRPEQVRSTGRRRVVARRRRVAVRFVERGGAADFKELETRLSCITDSACKNQLVVVSVQYGPFNTYIPIRSTTIGKSRVARDPIAMHTSWRSNSDIASVTSIGYPRMRASGESSTTKHRLLHASGSHSIPPPNDPKTNQYNQDLGHIHSTNGNHLEIPNEGSSIDHHVTIYLHAQNITMFPTNETWEHCDVLSMQIDSDLVIYRTTLVRTFQVWPPPSSPQKPPPPPRFSEICSDQLDEENPSAPISSGLLVQADEGVSLPVVDLIDVIYRRLP
ncbi:hypothetical protein F511_35772 [Dorcoceras hygrometricum]|uniref:Uncharacterized protein n=1 Tax=Dorcoceras hygrometricum TaxID=472368 RepID=A0A2Z7BWS2_9LAMI|nr:hypothetical protein F511_35772 [Dorcoceras hygrometricum]